MGRSAKARHRRRRRAEAFEASFWNLERHAFRAFREHWQRTTGERLHTIARLEDPDGGVQSYIVHLGGGYPTVRIEYPGPRFTLNAEP